jgi:hypothetical protein
VPATLRLPAPCVNHREHRKNTPTTSDRPPEQPFLPWPEGEWRTGTEPTVVVRWQTAEDREAEARAHLLEEPVIAWPMANDLRRPDPTNGGWF